MLVQLRQRIRSEQPPHCMPGDRTASQHHELGDLDHFPGKFHYMRILGKYFEGWPYSRNEIVGARKLHIFKRIQSLCDSLFQSPDNIIVETLDLYVLRL